VRTVRVRLAESIAGRPRVRPVAIIIDETMPATSRDFEVDSRMLADALLLSLPGGTVDALLRRLLEHRASQLVVPAVAPVEQMNEHQTKELHPRDCQVNGGRPHDGVCKFDG